MRHAIVDGPTGGCNHLSALNTHHEGSWRMSASDSTRFEWSTYFVRFGKLGPIKIGKTRIPPQIRLMNLQLSCPVKLRLMAVIKNPSREESEVFLHQRFSHLRIHGEWFEPAAELTDFIAGYPEWVDPPTCSELKIRAKKWERYEEKQREVQKQMTRDARKPRKACDPNNKGGRPKKCDRESRIRYAYVVLSGGISVNQAALAACVSRQTVMRFVKTLLNDGKDDTEILRRIREKRSSSDSQLDTDKFRELVDPSSAHPRPVRAIRKTPDTDDIRALHDDFPPDTHP
jgi:hypothetical protein